jgi:hypothetical protein
MTLSYQSVNPSTGKLLKSFEPLTSAQLENLWPLAKAVCKAGSINDVVNPAARSDKDSPMCGMPILNANKAKKCSVVKRGNGQGCAGIVNARFYTNNISMVCGDALALLQKMTESVSKSLGLPAAA